MTRILCVGSAVLDYVYAVDAMPSRPEKYRARNLVVVGGGVAANAAVAVARLGARRCSPPASGRTWPAPRLYAA